MGALQKLVDWFAGSTVASVLHAEKFRCGVAILRDVCPWNTSKATISFRSAASRALLAELIDDKMLFVACLATVEQRERIAREDAGDLLVNTAAASEDESKTVQLHDLACFYCLLMQGCGAAIDRND